LTEEEALAIAACEAVLPWAMFCGDTAPRDQADNMRQSIAIDLCAKYLGGMPGDPTGPAGSFSDRDTAIVPWLGAMISLQGIRHRAPSVRR
jgi:hypothetical protein